MRKYKVDMESIKVRNIKVPSVYPTSLTRLSGTWVPLHDGRDLAQRNGVLEKLRPIFDYVPGNESPPQAPKHTTAASNKPKIPKAVAAPRRPPSKIFSLTRSHVLIC